MVKSLRVPTLRRGNAVWTLCVPSLLQATRHKAETTPGWFDEKNHQTSLLSRLECYALIIRLEKMIHLIVLV